MQPVFPIEHQEVIALHQHVAHFKEGQSALHALLIAFAAQHAVDGEMDADIPHKVQEVQVADPVRIIVDKRLTVREIDQACHLLLEAGGIVVDLLVGHHAAHIGLSGWITNHCSTTAKQDDRSMTGPLHMRHGHQRNIVADVQAVSSWVKSNIKRYFFSAQQLAQLFGMRALLQKAAFFQMS